MIYLLRHGETEWNREGRRQGRLDSPLTSRGILQARACAGSLRGSLGGERVSLFACSPLGRAQETARIVADELRDVPPVRTEPLLAEHHMGDWQGLTSPEIEERYPGSLEERRSDLWTYGIPGGESYEDVSARASAWLDSVASEPVVVAVAHEMINRTVLGAYAGLDPAETLALSHPQNVVYRLSGGSFEALR